MVKVLDFGLAKLGAEGPLAGGPHRAGGTAPGGTRAGAVLGTAGYMSPEQAAGGLVDTSSDLWAFGVVLLEMLTARQAFPSEAGPEMPAHARTADPDWTWLPADTPPAVRKLLERCLEKNPARRIGSATAVQVGDRGRVGCRRTKAGARRRRAQETTGHRQSS